MSNLTKPLESLLGRFSVDMGIPASDMRMQDQMVSE